MSGRSKPPPITDPGPWFSIDDLVARKWSGSTMKAHLRPYLPAARIVGAKDFYDTLWSRALIRSIERRCLATRQRSADADKKELEQRFVTGRRVYQPGDPDVVVTNPSSQA